MNMFKNATEWEPENRALSILLYTAILFSGVLAVYNFLQFRSLWLDEAMLALNIRSHSYAGLLLPLDHLQVAPIGFLFLQKASGSAFNYADWSFRLFPLLTYFLSVYFVYRISKLIVTDRFYALLTASFFGLSYHALYYSSEFKPYISDVFFFCLILFFAISFSISNTKINSILLSLVGIFSIWFSTTSIIGLVTAGFFLLYTSFKKREFLFPVIIIGVAWLLSLGTYYFLFIKGHPHQERMLAYWTAWDGFLPANVLSVAFFSRLLDFIKELFSLVWPGYSGLITLPLSMLGWFSVYRQNRALAFLLCGPILIHLILSYLSIYPFSIRLILYFSPVLMILVVAGLLDLKNRLNLTTKLEKGLLFGLPLLLCFLFLGMRPFPVRKENMKKALTVIKQEINSGDAVYVHNAAVMAFDFYAPELLNIPAKDSVQIVRSKRSLPEWSDYSAGILAISRPVWVVFSHISKDKRKSGMDESTYVLQIFKQAGFSVDSGRHFHGTSLYRAIPDPDTSGIESRSAN